MDVNKIPTQLCDEKFRFIKIKKGDKRPLELEWTSKNNYKFNDKNFIAWLDAGNSYGVCGGYGKLLVVDFDDPTFEEEFIPKLPDTFTIKTGGGGKHLYYFVDDAASFKILGKEKNTLADIQGRGKQVIGAGSLHPSGKYYEVVEDVPIASITLKSLKIIFSEHLKDNKKGIGWDNVWDKETTVQQIKDKVSLISMLSEYGYNTSKNPTICGLGHGSKGGSCFSFNDHLWNCFHCDAGGDIFNLVMEHENCDFVKAKEILMKKAGMEIPVYNTPVSKGSVETLRTNVIMLIASKKNSQAVEAMVRGILAEFKISTIRDDEKPEMWIYSEGIYIPHGKTFIQEFCREVLLDAYQTHFINKVIERVRVDTYVDQDKFFINERLNLIPCQNGILNLKTKKLEPFNSKYKFFNKMPMRYDPEAECPSIEEFFKSALRDQTDIDVIQEIFGFLLYRDYFVEKAIMFHGDGRNGKSKCIELMKRFIGVENCANIPLQSLDKDQFAMGELFNKMANLAADLPSTALTETGNFKSLTGHDLISAARKFLTRVHFVNYAKMIFSANELPDTPDITAAFFLRWVVIDFPYTFVSEKELAKNRDDLSYKLADKSIIDKISTTAELTGLLNWALIGLDRLKAKSDFSQALGAEEIKSKWLRKASSVKGFVEDCIRFNYGSEIPKGDVSFAYYLYCRDNKVKKEKDSSLHKYIQDNVACDNKKARDGTGTWVYKGFTLVEKYHQKLNQLHLCEEIVE